MTNMNPKKIILRNFPHNCLYDEASFLGKLHETEQWDIDEYWLLEWSIVTYTQKKVDKKLDWEVFRIFSFLTLTIGSHLDKNDFFKIKNLQASELYEFRERIHIIFESYFSQEIIKQNMFETVNPYLKLSE